MSSDWTTAPYAEWLEECIKTMIEANPVAIAMEMVGEDGMVSTCYYNVSPNDRACMMDAMQDDAREMWVRDNKVIIKAFIKNTGLCKTER